MCIKRICQWVMAACIAFMGGHSMVSANTDISEPPISVMPVYPENQVDGNRAYFDVVYEKTDTHIQQQWLVNIVNQSDTEQKIRLAVSNTTFSGQGAFTYNEDEPLVGQRITDDRYDMRDYLRIDGDETEFTIPVGKTIQVPVSFEMDNTKEPFSGQLMGGLLVYLENKGGDDESQFGVTTETRFVVATVVTVGEKDATKFEVDGSAKAQPMPMYLDVQFPIHHASGSVLPKAKIEYGVWDKDVQLFASETPRVFNFSPYSETYVSFPWASDAIEKGKQYHLKGTITYVDDKGKEHVEPFGSYFEYTGDEDYMYRNGDLGKPTVTSGAWKWALLLIPLFIAALVWFLRRRKRYVLVGEVSDTFTTLLIDNDVTHPQDAPFVRQMMPYQAHVGYHHQHTIEGDMYACWLYKRVTRKIVDTNGVTHKVTAYEFTKKIMKQKPRVQA